MKRPTDNKLRTLLMLAHAHLHQHVPLHHKMDETRKLQKDLQEAWEGLQAAD